MSSPRLLVSPDFLQSVNVSILPRSDNSYDLGSSSFRWRNVHLYRRLNVANELNLSKASGHAIFGSNVWFDGTAYQRTKNGVYGSIVVLRNDASSAHFEIRKFDPDVTSYRLMLDFDLVREIKRIRGSIQPFLDNIFDLGSSSLRWKNGYFAGLLDIGSLRIGGTEIIDNIRYAKQLVLYDRSVIPEKSIIYSLNSDYLANADKRYTVTITPTPDAGGEYSLFDYLGDTFISYTTFSTQAPITITIENIDNLYWHTIKYIILDFNWGYGCTGIKVEAYKESSPGSGYTWEVIYETTTNTESQVLVIPVHIAYYTALRFTFSGSALSSSGEFRLAGIYALGSYVRNPDVGHYIPRRGGNVFGSLACEAIHPRTDNSYDLGSSSYRWKNGYFGGDIYVNGNKVWHAGNDGAGSGLDADLLDGKQSGNSSGQIPVSNGTKCTNLNADMVDGEHASAFTHARNGGKNIWVQSSAPTAQATGDIWIQT